MRICNTSFVTSTNDIRFSSDHDLRGIGSQFQDSEAELEIIPDPRPLPAIAFGTATGNPLYVRGQPISFPQATGTKCQPASDAEWEHIRPAFENIYLSPGMTLNRTIKCMSVRYNFNATPAMYKKRIKKWCISKNTGFAQREQLLETIAKHISAVDSRKDVVPTDIRDAIRHTQKKRRDGTLGEDEAAALIKQLKIYQTSALSHRQQTPRKLCARNTEREVPDASHSLGPSALNVISVVEQICHGTRYAGMFGAQLHADLRCRTASDLMLTRELVAINASLSAEAKLMAAIASMDQDLREKTFDTASLLDEVFNSMWLSYPEWHQKIVSSVYRHAWAVLPEKHPICLVLFNLQEILKNSDSRMRVLKCMYEYTSQRNGNDHNLRFRTSSCLSLIRAFRYADKLVDAESLCLRMISELPDLSAKNAPALRCRFPLVSELARIQRKRGAWASAASTLLQGYAQACTLGDTYVMFDAADQLAWTYWKYANDLDATEYWYRVALYHAQGDVAIRPTLWRLVLFQDAMELLREIGDDDRLQRFQEDFVDLYMEYMTYTDNVAQWL